MRDNFGSFILLRVCKRVFDLRFEVGVTIEPPALMRSHASFDAVEALNASAKMSFFLKSRRKSFTAQEEREKIFAEIFRGVRLRPSIERGKNARSNGRSLDAAREPL